MDDFLNSCCRICLAVEHTMISTFDRIEDFDLAINELLLDCVNIKIMPDGIDPKLICEECASELILVAKFHEKCKSATETLSQLKESNEPKCHNDSLPANVQIISGQTENIDEMFEEDQLIDDDNVVMALHDNTTSAETVTASPLNTTVKHEQVEYITDTTALEDDFDYVIIDENVVSLPPIYRQSIDEDSLIEEIDDNVTVVTEYLNDADELTDSGQGNLDDDDSGGAGGSNSGGISSAEIDVNDVTDDLDGVIRNQLNRAKRRKVEFGGLKASSKININYSCNLCGAGFAQFTNLTRHLETHSKMVPGEMLTCASCKETFTEIRELTEHIKEQQCNKINSEEISQEISDPDQPIIHERYKKQKKKCHICKMCNKGFSSSSLLLTHIRVHTGEKPFPCQICTKTFATQGGLDLHVRRHSGYKPYMCNVCDRGFAESSNLKVHMRIHTGEKPHRCTRCDRSFSRVFLLQIHQRTHTGEKPYGCDVCLKSFAQQGDLASHKRIHSGERPHVCAVCNKGFIKSSGLTQHMRRHVGWNTDVKPAINSRKNIGQDENTVETIDGDVYVLFDGE